MGNGKKLLSLPPEIIHHCVNGGIGHLEDQGSVILALVLIKAVVYVFVGKAITPACHLIVQIRLALAGGVAGTHDFHILVLLGIRILFLQLPFSVKRTVGQLNLFQLTKFRL